MTIANKTPMARKAAWSYCRRCLAVMLCCVLVFGLTVRTAPRAEAVVAEGAVALVGTSSGFAAAPIGGVIALVGLAAVGLEFGTGYFEHDNARYYTSRAYNAGAACWNYLEGLGGDIADWCMSSQNIFAQKGGIASGDSVEFPPDVLNAIRQWANSNFDFVNGAVTYTDRGIFAGNTQLVFTPYPSGYSWSNVPSSAVSLGTVVPYGGSLTATFSDANGDPVTLEVCLSNDGDTMYYRFVEINSVPVSVQKNSFFLHLREFNGQYFLCSGVLYPDGKLQFNGYAYKYLSDLQSRFPAISVSSIADVAGAITKTPAFEDEDDEPKVGWVPQGLPQARVGGVDVPVSGDWSPGNVLEEPVVDNPAIPGTGTGITAGEISQAITDALPITGTAVGDQVVGEAMTEPDSLGAVFVSKFPFSIPWDVAKAIQLLAAPPVTPYWEVDFMQPIAGRVGGFQGSTTIVIDFGEYPIVGIATRWFSTLMFVYALASGTKKLIWTA